jgi:hypothetical protein
MRLNSGFPLTPALSPREKENRFQRSNCFTGSCPTRHVTSYSLSLGERVRVRGKGVSKPLRAVALLACLCLNLAILTSPGRAAPASPQTRGSPPSSPLDYPTNYQGTGLCQFVLEGYVLTPPVEKSINQVVQRLLDQHQTAFDFKANADFRLHVRIFGRFPDFARFTTNHGVSVPGMYRQGLTNLQGYYSHSTKELVTWRQFVNGHFGSVLLHESSHAIMDAHFRRVPQWLLEGCAEYFSFPPDMQDAAHAQMLKIRWGLLSLWLHDKKLPALKDFLDLAPDEWNHLDIERAYTASWSLFQFLMSTEKNRKMMTGWLREMQSRRSFTPETVALVERDYPGGLTQFEADWHKWIGQGGHQFLSEKALEQLRAWDQQREHHQPPTKP